MATSSRKIPPLGQIREALSVCALPIHIWAIIALLREMPAWIERGHSTWEMLGIASYTLMFALLESVLLLLLLTLVAVVLPRGWFKDRFVAIVAVFVLFTAVFACLAQLNVIQWWNFKHLVLWMIPFVLLLVASITLVQRSDKIESAIISAVRRLGVLSWLYLAASVAGTFIVILRLIVARE